MWSKKGIQGAFRLCLKPFPGPKSSMPSSFLRKSAPTIHPYGRQSTTQNVILQTRVLDGNLRGRRVEPSIRMGDVLFEGGLAACRAPCPSFLREVTNLPHLAII